MCYIMESLLQYVPTCEAMQLLKLCHANGEERFMYNNFHSHPILLQGDLLTIICAKGVQLLCSNHENRIDRLVEGFLPFAEDWHTRQSLLRV